MDKKQINKAVRDYLFATAMTMFKYDGLPDNVRPEDLERMLLENGELIFTKWNDEFYIFQFTGAGKQNYLGEWDSYQVNNPYVNCNRVFTDKDAVRVRNTDNAVSLAGMLDMYSELLSESYITLNMSDVNARLSFLISAGDNATKASAEMFLKQVYDGKQGIIGSQPLLESLSVNPLAEHRDFQSVIELNKFYYSDFFQKIGLTNLYNNIHDRISATETEFTATSIYPFVDNMKKNREAAVEKINQMFGLNVTVEFTSSWDYRLMNGQNLKESDFKSTGLFDTGSSRSRSSLRSLRSLKSWIMSLRRLRMKTISEVIGTADLFAEIQRIHEFAAFRNVETRDLTTWFLAYHGDRLVQPGISDMTVQQLARMIVHFKQDVIETLTEHAAKVFQAVLNDGSSVTTHTHEGTTGQTQKQQVVPNNLTEMRDKSQITTDGENSYTETTTVNKDLNTDYKQVLFTNDLLCDIFAVIANAISLYVYM